MNWAVAAFFLLWKKKKDLFVVELDFFSGITVVCYKKSSSILFLNFTIGSGASISDVQIWEVRRSTLKFWTHKKLECPLFFSNLILPLSFYSQPLAVLKPLEIRCLFWMSRTNICFLRKEYGWTLTLAALGVC